MVVERRLRKLIILSAGILNFATKRSSKAMNQRYILARIATCCYLHYEILLL
jgi:uncharacterized protein with PQ loop repeat